MGNRSSTGKILSGVLMPKLLSAQELLAEVNLSIENFKNQINPTNRLQWQEIIKYIDKNIALAETEEARDNFKLQLYRTFGNDLVKLNKVAETFANYQLTPAHPHHHIKDTLPHILDYAMKMTSKDSSVVQDDFLALINTSAEDNGIKFKELMDTVVIKGLAHLTKTQDPDQAYHTIAHAMEMQRDSSQKMRAIILSYKNLCPESAWAKMTEQTIERLCLITGALAAFHDIVQNKGQFKNEKESALEFCKIFKAEFISSYPDKEIPVFIEDLAEKIIIDGTLLNMSFSPPKHTTLVVIQKQVLSDVGIGIEEGSAQDIIETMAGILANNDVHRAGNKSTYEYQFRDEQGNPLGKMPATLDELLVQTLTEGLQQEPYNLDRVTANALVVEQLEAFKILIGQNIRMMADGPFRKFRDNQMNEFMQLMDTARVASPEKFMQQIKSFSDGGTIIINKLLDEANFAKGMDPLELVKAYQVVKNVAAMQTFLQQMLLPNAANIPPNLTGQINTVWDVHSKIFLPILHAAFKKSEQLASPELRENLMASIVFSAANQQGLNILAQEKNILCGLFKEVYGMEINSELTSFEFRVVASAYMSLSQDPEMHVLINQPQQDIVAIKVKAEKRLADFAEEATLAPLFFKGNVDAAAALVINKAL
jgi:hypothetical protein